MKPARPLSRWERAFRVAAGVLGAGIALLGVAALFARAPLGWSIAALFISLGTLWCAFSPARPLAVRALPFLLGGALVALGGIGFAGELRPGFVLAAIALGVITLVVGILAEFPELLGGPRPRHRRRVVP